MIVSDEIVGEWVCQKVGRLWIPEGTLSIGEIEEGKIKAGVFYHDYNGASIEATIAVEGCFSRRFIREILRYPFDIVKVKCIYVTISTGNKKSVNFVNKLGFKQVGIIPKAALDGDLLIMNLTAEDCIRYMR